MSQSSYSPHPERYQHSVGYRFCGKSGLKLPQISLGLWHNFGDVDDATEAEKMIQFAFDNGITHFDLANNYGTPAGSAETNFGKILKKTLLLIAMKWLSAPKQDMRCGRAHMAMAVRENI